MSDLVVEPNPNGEDRLLRPISLLFRNGGKHPHGNSIHIIDELTGEQLNDVAHLNITVAAGGFANATIKRVKFEGTGMTTFEVEDVHISQISVV